MKQLLYGYFFGAVYILSPLWRNAEGQYFEDPSKNFQPFLMEWVNRGSYNMSSCVNDLINCWEIVRAEVICSHERYFETICGMSREYCQDLLGDFDTYLSAYQFTMFESVCASGGYEEYT